MNDEKSGHELPVSQVLRPPTMAHSVGDFADSDVRIEASDGEDDVVISIHERFPALTLKTEPANPTVSFACQDFDDDEVMVLDPEICGGLQPGMKDALNVRGDVVPVEEVLKDPSDPGSLRVPPKCASQLQRERKEPEQRLCTSQPSLGDFSNYSWDMRMDSGSGDLLQPPEGTQLTPSPKMPTEGNGQPAPPNAALEIIETSETNCDGSSSSGDVILTQPNVSGEFGSPFRPYNQLPTFVRRTPALFRSLSLRSCGTSASEYSYCSDGRLSTVSTLASVETERGSRQPQAVRWVRFASQPLPQTERARDPRRTASQPSFGVHQQYKWTALGQNVGEVSSSISSLSVSQPDGEDSNQRAFDVILCKSKLLSLCSKPDEPRSDGASSEASSGTGRPDDPRDLRDPRPNTAVPLHRMRGVFVSQPDLHLHAALSPGSEAPRRLRSQPDPATAQQHRDDAYSLLRDHYRANDDIPLVPTANSETTSGTSRATSPLTESLDPFASTTTSPLTASPRSDADPLTPGAAASLKTPPGPTTDPSSLEATSPSMTSPAFLPTPCTECAVDPGTPRTSPTQLAAEPTNLDARFSPPATPQPARCPSTAFPGLARITLTPKTTSPLMTSPGSTLTQRAPSTPSGSALEVVTPEGSQERADEHLGTTLSPPRDPTSPQTASPEAILNCTTSEITYPSEASPISVSPRLPTSPSATQLAPDDVVLVTPSTSPRTVLDPISHGETSSSVASPISVPQRLATSLPGAELALDVAVLVTPSSSPRPIMDHIYVGETSSLAVDSSASTTIPGEHNQEPATVFITSPSMGPALLRGTTSPRAVVDPTVSMAPASPGQLSATEESPSTSTSTVGPTGCTATCEAIDRSSDALDAILDVILGSVLGADPGPSSNQALDEAAVVDTQRPAPQPLPGRSPTESLDLLHGHLALVVADDADTSIASRSSSLAHHGAGSMDVDYIDLDFAVGDGTLNQDHEYFMMDVQSVMDVETAASSESDSIATLTPDSIEHGRARKSAATREGESDAVVPGSSDSHLATAPEQLDVDEDPQVVPDSVVPEEPKPPEVREKEYYTICIGTSSATQAALSTWALLSGASQEIAEVRRGHCMDPTADSETAVQEDTDQDVQLPEVEAPSQRQRPVSNTGDADEETGHEPGHHDDGTQLNAKDVLLVVHVTRETQTDPFSQPTCPTTAAPEVRPPETKAKMLGDDLSTGSGPETTKVEAQVIYPEVFAGDIGTGSRQGETREEALPEMSGDDLGTGSGPEKMRVEVQEAFPEMSGGDLGTESGPEKTREVVQEAYPEMSGGDLGSGSGPEKTREEVQGTYPDDYMELNTAAVQPEAVVVSGSDAQEGDATETAPHSPPSEFQLTAVGRPEETLEERSETDRSEPRLDLLESSAPSEVEKETSLQTKTPEECSESDQPQLEVQLQGLTQVYQEAPRPEVHPAVNPVRREPDVDDVDMQVACSGEGEGQGGNVQALASPVGRTHQDLKTAEVEEDVRFEHHDEEDGESDTGLQGLTQCAKEYLLEEPAVNDAEPELQAAEDPVEQANSDRGSPLELPELLLQDVGVEEEAEDAEVPWTIVSVRGGDPIQDPDVDEYLCEEDAEPAPEPSSAKSSLEEYEEALDQSVEVDAGGPLRLSPMLAAQPVPLGARSGSESPEDMFADEVQEVPVDDRSPPRSAALKQEHSSSQDMFEDADDVVEVLSVTRPKSASHQDILDVSSDSGEIPCSQVRREPLISAGNRNRSSENSFYEFWEAPTGKLVDLLQDVSDLDLSFDCPGPAPGTSETSAFSHDDVLVDLEAVTLGRFPNYIASLEKRPEVPVDLDAEETDAFPNYKPSLGMRPASLMDTELDAVESVAELPPSVLLERDDTESVGSDAAAVADAVRTETQTDVIVEVGQPQPERDVAVPAVSAPQQDADDDFGDLDDSPDSSPSRRRSLDALYLTQAPSRKRTRTRASKKEPAAKRPRARAGADGAAAAGWGWGQWYSRYKDLVASGKKKRVEVADQEAAQRGRQRPATHMTPKRLFGDEKENFEPPLPPPAPAPATSSHLTPVTSPFPPDQMVPVDISPVGAPGETCCRTPLQKPSACSEPGEPVAAERNRTAAQRALRLRQPLFRWAAAEPSLAPAANAVQGQAAALDVDSITIRSPERPVSPLLGRRPLIRLGLSRKARPQPLHQRHQFE